MVSYHFAFSYCSWDSQGKNTEVVAIPFSSGPHSVRFKGLDLIERVPDELWNEIRDIVQKTGIKTIPMEKKGKKAKWLSEEALQIAVKRRKAKIKGEKERYTSLNAKFQRIGRRDKKAFLSDQCKEIEENYIMKTTEENNGKE